MGNPCSLYVFLVFVCLFVCLMSLNRIKILKKGIQLIQLRKLKELEFQCYFAGLVSVWCAKGGNQEVAVGCFGPKICTRNYWIRGDGN